MIAPMPPMKPMRVWPAPCSASSASSMVWLRSGRTESNQSGAGFVSMNVPYGNARRN